MLWRLFLMGNWVVGGSKENNEKEIIKKFKIVKKKIKIKRKNRNKKLLNKNKI